MSTESSLVINVAVSLASAFLAAYLTSKRFASEKWWDKKVKSYTEILENLSFMYFYYSSNWFHISETTLLSTEAQIELHNKYLKSKEVLVKYGAIKEIFISKEAASILAEYLESHETNKPQDFELTLEQECGYYNGQLELAEEVIKDFREAAKKELKSGKLFKPVA